MSSSRKLSLRLAAAAACIFLPAAARALTNVAVYVSAPTVTSAENSNLVPMNSETIATENFDGTGFAGITKATALPNPYTSTALGGDTITPSGSVTVNPNTSRWARPGSSAGGR